MILTADLIDCARPGDEVDLTGRYTSNYDSVLNTISGFPVFSTVIEANNMTLRKDVMGNQVLSQEDIDEKFGFLVEAFRYGTPPHGGMAYGLDRMVMLMLKKDSIRDVIAFPKVQNAGEPMSGAPDIVDPQQLKDLSIALTLTE